MVHFRFFIYHWVYFFVAFVIAATWTFVVAANMDPSDVTDKDETKWQTYNYIAASIFVAFAIVTVIWGVIRTNKLKGEGYIDGLSPAEQAAVLHNKLSSMTKQKLQESFAYYNNQNNNQNNNSNNGN